MGGVAKGERGGHCRMVNFFEGQVQSDVLPRPRGVVWGPCGQLTARLFESSLKSSILVTFVWYMYQGTDFGEFVPAMVFASHVCSALLLPPPGILHAPRPCTRPSLPPVLSLPPTRSLPPSPGLARFSLKPPAPPPFLPPSLSRFHLYLSSQGAARRDMSPLCVPLEEAER